MDFIEQVLSGASVPLLIVISGPAAGGKDALIRKMRKRGYPFHFVVTATDRPPRVGEADGVDYHFLTSEQFTGMIENDEFLEHATVYGQRKGIPKQEVRKAFASGLDAVLRVDVQGAETVWQIVPEAISIFLTAPSERELEQRLRARGGDTEAQVEKRLKTAREEIARLGSFQYAVVNHDQKLDQAVDDVLAIVRAEHLRVGRRPICL